MLVLTRKKSQSIIIGDNITITLVEIRGNKAVIAIQAPGDIRIMRAEIAIPAQEEAA